MKFAVCNELYQDWPLEKAFAHAADVGYSGIEIAPFTLAEHVDDITQSDRQQVCELANRFGLEIVGLHWLLAKTTGLHVTTADPGVRDRTADYLRKLAILCSDLDGQVMVFGSPQQRNLDPSTSREQGMERAAGVIAQLVPTLEERGVTLALEPLGPEEGNFLLTADETVELIERVDSPNVRLHLDVKAMSTEPNPIPEIIRNHREHLVHFHANDPNRRGPGMGQVEFGPIFQSLEDIEYQGWVSVEVFDYEPGIDALAGESFDYMTRIRGELGHHKS